MNIRKANEEDRQRIADYIAKDPLHNGKGSVDDFYQDGTELMVVEDGETFFYVQIGRALRIRALFDVDDKKKSKNARMLVKFTPWIADMGKKAGFKELIFATESEPLARFEERLGFQASPNELVMPL